MKATLPRAAANIPIVLEEIDISRDPRLLAEYEERIPLLWLNGRLSAKFRIEEAELTRKLEAARSIIPQDVELLRQADPTSAAAPDRDVELKGSCSETPQPSADQPLAP